VCLEAAVSADTGMVTADAVTAWAWLCRHVQCPGGRYVCDISRVEAARFVSLWLLIGISRRARVQWAHCLVCSCPRRMGESAGSEQHTDEWQLCPTQFQVAVLVLLCRLLSPVALPVTCRWASSTCHLSTPELFADVSAALQDLQQQGARELGGAGPA